MKNRRPYSEILKELENNHKEVPTQKEIDELAEIINEKDHLDINSEDITIEKVASQKNKDNSDSESSWL